MGHVDPLIWGLTAFLAGDLLARARTRNRAVVGHIPYMCLRRVSIKLPQKRGHAPVLSIEVLEKTGTSPRALRLHIHLGGRADPSVLVGDLLRRYATYWLTKAEAQGNLKLGEEHKLKLALLKGRATSGIKLAPVGQWMVFSLPAHAPFSEGIVKMVGITRPSASA